MIITLECECCYLWAIFVREMDGISVEVKIPLERVDLHENSNGLFSVISIFPLNRDSGKERKFCILIDYFAPKSKTVKSTFACFLYEFQHKRTIQLKIKIYHNLYGIFNNRLTGHQHLKSMHFLIVVDEGKKSATNCMIASM